MRMAQRNLSLVDRDIQSRELRPPSAPRHFTIQEISERFNKGLGAVYEQVSIAERLLTDNNVDAGESILRSQIVQSESLLDFYMHEVTKYCLLQMFMGNWEKSKKYGSLKMLLDCVEEGIGSADLNEWFFGYVNDSFSRVVMLSTENIKDQLNLLGLSAADVIADAFPDLENGHARNQLIKDMFDRRNAIAHQDDRSHETAERNPIDADQVRRYAQRVRALADAVSNAVRTKESESE